MKDDDTEDYWGQDEDRDGFMSRLVELFTNDKVSYFFGCESSHISRNVRSLVSQSVSQSVS